MKKEIVLSSTGEQDVVLFGWDDGMWEIYIGDSAFGEQLTSNDYQYYSKETAVYPEDRAIEYLTLGLVGESGEVAGKVKKYIRGDYELDQEHIEMIKDELGDVLWYLSQICTKLDINLEDVFGSNLYKLFDRKNRGVLKGSGDNR